jgi:hypothetical protein
MTELSQGEKVAKVGHLWVTWKNNKNNKKKKMKKKKKPADSSSLHFHGAAQPAFQTSFDTAEQLAWAWCVDS